VGNAEFVCTGLDSSSDINNSIFAYGATPASQVTVIVPTPITVTSTAIGLALDLLISKSATFSSCEPNGNDQYSINPTFNLTSIPLSSQSTNVVNKKLTGLTGIVTAVEAATNNFTVTSANGPVWSVQSGNDTIFQGVPGFSALVAGISIDMDVALQTDGSLRATRVEVNDSNPTTLSAWSGPLQFVISSPPILNLFGRQEQGYLYTPTDVPGTQVFTFGDTAYKISAQLANLQSLPFAATFTASNMVAGQNASVSAHALNIESGPTYVPASTITLLPQTINGTVSDISTSSSFTTYTVTLAPYDLFPNLAVQAKQTTLLTNPNTVVVYVDSTTQLLNTTPVAVGTVLRFYGLVFNDNGTLRMDCAQINDGVAE
jgi:hypothetical protein